MDILQVPEDSDWVELGDEVLCFIAGGGGLKVNAEGKILPYIGK
jgi:hypothetical protein